jgi:WD40 repeat protein
MHTRHLKTIISLFAITLSISAIRADETIMTGKPSGQILATGSRRVLIMDEKGKILWQHKGENVSDCWMLKNGNVLFSDNNVTLVDPNTDKILFSYKPSIKKGGGVFGCQPLQNGNILIGENSTGKILELSRDGNVAFELQLPLFKPGGHHNFRMVRKLENGNYLVCHSGNHLVREYTPQGKVTFEVKVDNIAFSAVRLNNGNTLVGQIGHITEFDSKGEIVWQFSNDDIQGLKINWMCGIHVQPNGNLAVGVYSAYKGGGQVGLFEISRDKKIVWKYAHPKSDKSMMSIQLLTPDGKRLPGKLLR